MHPYTARSAYQSYGAGGLYSGAIQLEPNVWQLVAINSKFGRWVTDQLVNDASVAKIKEYVVDQLIYKYGANCVTVCTAYPGDENRFFAYVPGSTPAASEHNFPLMYLDAQLGAYEPNPFWLKSNYGSPMTLDFVEWR